MVNIEEIGEYMAVRELGMNTGTKIGKEKYKEVKGLAVDTDRGAEIKLWLKEGETSGNRTVSISKNKMFTAIPANKAREVGEGLIKLATFYEQMEETTTN